MTVWGTADRRALLSVVVFNWNAGLVALREGRGYVEAAGKNILPPVRVVELWVPWLSV